MARSSGPVQSRDELLYIGRHPLPGVFVPPSSGSYLLHPGVATTGVVRKEMANYELGEPMRKLLSSYVTNQCGTRKTRAPDGSWNWPLPKRVGSWVRITTAMALGIVWTRDRIQSTNPSIKQKSQRQLYNCCVPGCTNSHNRSGAAFLRRIFAYPVPPNDPKCLCVADSDPGSHSFW